MLNLEIFSTRISIRIKIFTASLQHNRTKTAIIPKCISYHYSFEKYINKYLPSFSIDDAEKFDLFANKNSKYLSYKFNDEIEALGGEKRIIQHTAKMKGSISLKKLERDKQLLVEKIIHSIEFSNSYENPTEKTPRDY